MDTISPIDKLYSLQRFGIKLGLQNIQGLLEYLDNPQNKFKSIHVAGSNGKGSTVSFIASILQEAGLKTGIYTSPHFVNFNERIKVNNIEIPNSYIEKFISSINQFIDDHKPTFFEVTTALAFNYFADQEVDFAVIETGLGGRFDATNVIIPEASVITTISLEHTEHLGNSIESIAFEKAGIIKKNKNVFIGRLPFEAEDVIEKKCNELNNSLYKLDNFLKEYPDSINFISPEIVINKMIVPLLGRFQNYNAALAVLTITKTLKITDNRIIEAGLNNVYKNTGIQGRYEIYSESPRIIFDSAHNPEGVETFLSAFKEESSGYAKRILFFGAMRDKNIEDMLKELKNYFDEIRFIRIEYDRCATLEELSTIGRELNLNFILEFSPVEYIEKFVEDKTKNNVLVLLGSIYILGKIKSDLLIKKKLDIFK